MYNNFLENYGLRLCSTNILTQFQNLCSRTQIFHYFYSININIIKHLPMGVNFNKRKI